MDEAAGMVHTITACRSPRPTPVAATAFILQLEVAWIKPECSALLMNEALFWLVDKVYDVTARSAARRVIGGCDARLWRHPYRLRGSPAPLLVTAALVLVGWCNQNSTQQPKALPIWSSSAVPAAGGLEQAGLPSAVLNRSPYSGPHQSLFRFSPTSRMYAVTTLDDVICWAVLTSLLMTAHFRWQVHGCELWGWVFLPEVYTVFYKRLHNNRCKADQ